MTNPLVSVHVTSFNKFLHFKNLIESFVHCNVYENIELIIVDNGSTDQRLLEYYEGLQLPFPFRLIRNEKNDYPRCIWHAKNQARMEARGEYFLDIPDDHQFVRKGDWIRECLDIYSSIDNIGCIVLYAYPIFRWTKANNRLRRERRANNISFYISYFKGYVDYHFMSRTTYEKVGPFLDTGYDSRIVPEPDYMRRCTALGLRRLFLKFPASVSIPSYLDDRLIEFESQPVHGYLSSNDYTRWENLKRPVSAEEIRQVSFAKHLSNTPRDSFRSLVESSIDNEISEIQATRGSIVADSTIRRKAKQLVLHLAKKLT